MVPAGGLRKRKSKAKGDRARDGVPGTAYVISTHPRFYHDFGEAELAWNNVRQAKLIPSIRHEHRRGRLENKPSGAAASAWLAQPFKAGAG